VELDEIPQLTPVQAAQIWAKVIRLSICDLVEACEYFAGAKRHRAKSYKHKTLGSSAAWFLFGDGVGIDEILDDDVVGYLRQAARGDKLIRSLDGPKALKFFYHFKTPEMSPAGRAVLDKAIAEIREIEAKR
jgi:hypothetical protein